MNRCRRLATLVLGLLFSLEILPAGAMAAASVKTPDPLTILFTHDTHDHFLPASDGNSGEYGGYTRLATLLEEQREIAANSSYGENGLPVVTLDAGDFSMGSLFQTIYTTDAPELRALGAMGYDVTTLGNHEFDYRQQGLADMLHAAKDSGDLLPAIVQANYTSPKDPAGSAALTEAFENYPVTDYVILERPGYSGIWNENALRIAVFGVMGVDSDECAPMSGMVFEPIADAARRVVAEIQEKEHPDYIICLSHSGTEDGKGEDYELAKAVDGIDVIISGHTHTALAQPIQVNDTLIVSCGEYTQNLGVLTIGRSGGNGAVELLDYQLIPIDGSIPNDPDMTALAERFKTKVNENYLSGYGLDYDKVLTLSQTDFTISQTGALIGQAYIDTVKAIEGSDYEPIAFAVAPDGVIRGCIRKGVVTTAQAFDILSLGSGADGTPAYPLLSVYLTGRDLKNVFEVDASISSLMPAATLYGAGTLWSYNPHRMFLDRVTDCRLIGTAPDGIDTYTYIDDNQLYRVVADLYTGQMLGAVEDKSFGLLSVTPRDSAGEEITNLESCILHDDSGAEVKAWYALASYLEQQEGLNQPLPACKAELASWNPVRLLIPMGAPTAILLAVLVLAAVLIALLVRRIRKKHRPA